MKKNNSYTELSNIIKNSKKILLFPHINIDGDAMGSSVALCRVLRNMGKEAYILVEDEISDNLTFLNDDKYITENQDIISNPDLTICVDCGEISRFPKRTEKFFSGKVTMCVDHHGTSDGTADYNIVEPEAAATGEILYRLFKEMDVDFDKEISNCLFTAITMDTGNFQYSNTTFISHQIVADLYKYGLDSNVVSINIYENNSWEKIQTEALVLAGTEFVLDGKIAIAKVTAKILKKTGCKMNETESIVSTLRSIGGVEIAALVKEDSKNNTRVSLRGKNYADVSIAAVALGGGGHVKAAGCTIEKNIDEATEIIKNELIKEIVRYNEN
ncbi:MAG: bifunctional oligoribonuclease/PAP phosphatase NrnA [Peptostreptococcaceae bacterium]|nr:bifunctional oligoribonuclease/PAP phosphatase NrnA [Peptostreptococcaceae bacterium]